MRRMPSQGPRRERGQALVETALTAMIILSLIAGLVDFGLAFGYKVAIVNAARAGTRWGIRFPTDRDDITGVALSALGGTLVLTEEEAAYDVNADVQPVWPDEWPDDRLTINVVGAGTTAERWDELTIGISYQYDPIFLSVFGVSSIPIVYTSTMLISGPDSLPYEP
ncbi:MAG: TadE/TadG family type IV pilus assembly protein [Anaerolineae bacterium]